MKDPLARHDFRPGSLDDAREFLKRAWWQLRALRKIRVWKNKLRVLDINQDAVEVRGVGYEDAAIVPLLKMVNAAFDPTTIHEPTTEEYKDFATGRRHPWAEDRVM